ncbi:uncharacterized protein LOC135929767 [Gordionus sp. m RMFG-2023]|uniref:uncharacterized protein LOC135929767 n=1 Tax=Gordionus sp. m RMFG-2023 TaxID=3053472 RepID=UPI0031FD332D
MDSILQQLINIGFSKEISLKSIAINGKNDLSKLINWIVSHNQDPLLKKDEDLNYIVLLSFSPNCCTSNYLVKQIYDYLVNHLNVYPSTCDYYFSIPLTPMFTVSTKNINILLEVFDQSSTVIQRLKRTHLSLTPYMNEYMIGCALSKDFQEIIQEFSLKLIDLLKSKNILKTITPVPLYSLLWDRSCSPISQDKLVFPILASVDPDLLSDPEKRVDSSNMAASPNTPPPPHFTPLQQLLENKMDNTKFQELSNKLKGLLNTYCYPQGLFPVDKNGDNELDCLSPDAFSINLLSIDDTLNQCQIFRSLVTPAKEHENSASFKPVNDISRIDIRSLTGSPKCSSVYAVHNVNLFDDDDELLCVPATIPRSESDSLLVKIGGIVKVLSSGEVSQELRVDDAILAGTRSSGERKSRALISSKSQSVKAISHKTGLYRTVHTEWLRKVPKICAWNVIDTIYLCLPPENVATSNGVENYSQVDGAPSRRNRILSKIDFYRMFTKYQDFSRSIPEELSEWWNVAKPDHEIDFEAEKLTVKHRYLLLRHGERSDQTFAPDWYDSVFKSETCQYFKKIRFYETLNWVYCSPSLRCVQTVHYILKGLGLDEALKIRIEPGLFEWYGWHREVKPVFMSPQRFKNCSFNIDTTYVTMMPEVQYNPSETLEEYYARGEKFMRLLAKRHDQQEGDFLIMGHAATLEVNTFPILTATTNPQKRSRDYQEFHEILQKTPYLACTRIDERLDGSWAWPPIPPSLPVTYLKNMSYDWTVLSSSK